MRQFDGWWLVLLGALACAGCSPAADSQRDPPQTQAEPLIELPEPPLESGWQAYFVGEAKIGYTHRTAEAVLQDGEPMFRFSEDSRLTLKRYDQTTTQSMLYSTLETPAGELVHYRSQIVAGPQANETNGRVIGDKLVLEATDSQTSSLAWKEDYGGPFAPEISLRRKPMQPGEKRLVKSLLPAINQVVDVELEAKQREATLMLDGMQELLRIESRAVVEIEPGKTMPIDSVNWVDDAGRVRKVHFPATNQTAYATTKEIARQESTGGQEFDLGLDTIVKLPEPLANSHETRNVVYRATLKHGNPAEVFARSGAQTVTAIDAHTAEIRVQALTPQTGAPAPDKQRPTAADSAANSFIQSDDARIVAMANSVAPQETDAWRTAVALEEFVHGAIRKKNFSQAFATAADVAVSREGDCTEHAVLLAALCRARRLPARTALGLVYYPQAQGFAYHMWTEVWIEDRWVPLDATLGRGGIGADHLKIADANLSGSSALAAFLPVAQVLGQLQLKVESVE